MTHTRKGTAPNDLILDVQCTLNILEDLDFGVSVSRDSDALLFLRMRLCLPRGHASRQTGFLKSFS
ncbi:MAG: hypothetical protein C4K48_05470 [Candidatus Thorarchaeota archaeon]|nr:MAG: hypothetical protein C4K48_05470 [Candidatus Thorarchaeota archaeon]